MLGYLDLPGFGRLLHLRRRGRGVRGTQWVGRCLCGECRIVGEVTVERHGSLGGDEMNHLACVHYCRREERTYVVLGVE